MNLDELLIYGNRWFVFHKENLYNYNPGLIGFREKGEWEKIHKGDLVVYYQGGTQRLIGFYEVTETGKNLDPGFGITSPSGNKEILEHQHRIKLIFRLNRLFSKSKSELSFYPLLNNPRRWDGERVFPLEKDDLMMILKVYRGI